MWPLKLQNWQIHTYWYNMYGKIVRMKRVNILKQSTHQTAHPHNMISDSSQTRRESLVLAFSVTSFGKEFSRTHEFGKKWEKTLNSSRPALCCLSLFAAVISLAPLLTHQVLTMIYHIIVQAFMYNWFETVNWIRGYKFQIKLHFFLWRSFWY